MSHAPTNGNKKNQMTGPPGYGLMMSPVMLSQIPQSPIFGVHGTDETQQTSKQMNLDDIFSDIFSGDDVFPESSDLNYDQGVPNDDLPSTGLSDDVSQKKRPRQNTRNMTEEQKIERRERNREHAKRSRVRKKFLLESLQQSVSMLQQENEKLRSAIRENLGSEASELIASTTNASHGLIASSYQDATKVLADPDYSLVKALQTAQQNFVITDPSLPDNPIVFASNGFLELTGYTLPQVLGRNCRFLQGPDTDPAAVEQIRNAISTGEDASVCLLNYKVDGTTFWNQFFIASLRDADGKIVNYVGVQCKVSEEYAKAVNSRKDDDK